MRSYFLFYKKNEEIKTFRYSSIQKMKETRSKKNLKIIVNRDINGSLNIRMHGLCHLKNKKIPKVFGRQKQ